MLTGENLLKWEDRVRALIRRDARPRHRQWQPGPGGDHPLPCNEEHQHICQDGVI